MHYMMIFCFAIALVLVIVKLLLEHQESEDAAKGIRQPHEEYTMKGMLKLMRAERKEKKRERKQSKREREAMETQVSSVSVRPFSDTKTTDGEHAE